MIFSLNVFLIVDKKRSIPKNKAIFQVAIYNSETIPENFSYYR